MARKFAETVVKKTILQMRASIDGNSNNYISGGTFLKHLIVIVALMIFCSCSIMQPYPLSPEVKRQVDDARLQRKIEQQIDCEKNCWSWCKENCNTRKEENK